MHIDTFINFIQNKYITLSLRTFSHIHINYIIYIINYIHC